LIGFASPGHSARMLDRRHDILPTFIDVNSPRILGMPMPSLPHDEEGRVKFPPTYWRRTEQAEILESGISTN
jgi:hypothetical protein